MLGQKQQLEKKRREQYHEAYNVEQESNKKLSYVETVIKDVLIFHMKHSKLITYIMFCVVLNLSSTLKTKAVLLSEILSGQIYTLCV